MALNALVVAIQSAILRYIILGAGNILTHPRLTMLTSFAEESGLPLSKASPSPWGSSSLYSDTSSGDYITSTDIDHLLVNCSNADFRSLWLIRLSQHDKWSKNSSAEHISQLMTIDTGPPPYSPITHRISKRVARSPCLDAQPLRDPQKPWFEFFVVGCTTTETEMLPTLAAEVLSQGSWDTQESILLLVHDFRTRYCEQSPWHSSSIVIPFMSAIHSCLDEKYGMVKARQFLTLVETSTMELFRATWTQVCSTNICCICFILNTERSQMKQNCLLRTPTMPGDVKQALLLSSYLGALLRSGLIFHGTVQLAISLLLDNIVVVEQLQALHCLMVAAGDRLWKPEALRSAMTRWLGEVKCRVAYWQRTLSSATMLKKPDVDDWVKVR